MNKKVSIVIPVPYFNDYIHESIKYYKDLDYENYEIIILPDEPTDEVLSKNVNIRVIPSGKVGPAEKRDMGVNKAKGEIIAFIDDDAYPTHEWLKNAVAHFDDETIAAVGGPAVTPKNEKFWQRVSGNVYASIIMSGQYRRRYIATGRVVEDYDIPTVNLIVRKDIFQKVGGFDSTFYPGEDTKLCLDIKKLGYKILYNPKVLVYHHRRNLFWTHFAQITNYAWHRGFFAKTYPETSRKLPYFIPSFFLLGVVFGGILGIFFPLILKIYLGALGFYGLINLITSFNINPLEWFWTFIGVFMSHLAYGFYFLKGLLFTKSIKR